MIIINYSFRKEKNYEILQTLFLSVLTRIRQVYDFYDIFMNEYKLGYQRIQISFI